MISVKDIIQQSWKIYESNFKKILKIIIWGFLAMSLSSIGLFLTDLYISDSVVKIFLDFLIHLPQILIAIWITIVLIDFLNKLLENKKTDISASVQKSFKIYLQVLLLTIIVSLIEIAGFVLLIIPGIIFTVWFVFSVYEMVLNNTKIVESLKISKKFSENRWFKVAWRYFAPGIFWSLAGWTASYILIFSTNQVLSLTKTTLDATGTKILELAIYICQNAFYIFFVPLIIASVVILYRELKKT